MTEARASDALDLALVVFANPGLVPGQRVAPIPAGIGDLLRVAAGQQESIERHCDRLGETPERLTEAARFFVEQLMLSREVASDPWRVLGAERGAPEAVVRENRHWLLRLVHPDRSSDWADAYADRVQRAWREVRAGAQGPVAHESEAEPSGDDDWDLTHGRLQTTAKPRVLVDLEPGHPNTGPRWGRWSFGGIALMFLAALVWGPQLEDALRGDELPVFGGAAETASDVQSQSTPSGQHANSAAEGPADLRGAPPTLVNAANPADPPAMPTVAAPTSTNLARAGAASTDFAANSNEPVPATPAVERRSPVADAPVVASNAARGNRPAPSVDAAAEQTPAHPAPRRRVPVSSEPDATPRLAASGSTDSRTGQAVTSPARDTRDTVAQAPDPSRPGSVVLASSAPAPRPTPRRDDAASSDTLPVATASAASGPPSNASDRAIAQPITQRSAEPASLAEQPDKRNATAVAVTAPANQAVAQPPRPAWPTIDEARQTVDAFQQHYGAGDLVSLVNLFAAGANPRRGGLAGLHADYAKLFGDTDTREIAFSAVRWQPSGNVLVGNGRFEAKLARKGRLFKQRVSGAVRVEVVSTEHGPRLFNLVPVEGG